MYCPCLGPNGMLYVIAFSSDILYEDGEYDEVFAFDAGTLELRLRFGGGKFKTEAYGHGSRRRGELYVGDRDARSLHVFSLAAEHLRELFGDWWTPNLLLHVDGRLYLTEQDGAQEIGEEEDMDDEDERPQVRWEAGRAHLCPHARGPDAPGLEAAEAGSCVFYGHLLE